MSNSRDSSRSGSVKRNQASIAINNIDDEDLRIMVSDEMQNTQFEPVQEIEKKYQQVELTPSQMTANLTLNFLNEICILDDKITAKQSLKNNQFFSYI